MHGVVHPSLGLLVMHDGMAARVFYRVTCLRQTGLPVWLFACGRLLVSFLLC